MFTRKNIFIGFLFLMLCFNSFSQDFITTWTVSAGDLTITIPTRGSGYDCTVDWGDSGPTITTHSGTSPVISHTYASAGTYQITISATTFGDTSPFPRIYFNELGDKDKIISIDQWGSNQWTSMANAFFGCSNLVNNATDTPNLTGLTSVGLMFRNATSIGGGTSTNWDSWNMSNVTSMVQMFRGATAFNEDISSWNVSLVSNMNNLFNGATAFNQDIGGWTTSSATTMITTFRNATSFDQDISGWNVENVTSMNNMFNGATLSIKNYSALLIAWETDLTTTLPVLSQNFHGGNSKYCSSAAITARNNIEAHVTGLGNTFVDGGLLSSYIWTGDTDTEWNTTSNWQDGYCIDCTLDVTIPSVTNHPIIDASTEVTVNDLTINSGAALTIEGGLTINGNLTTNDGLSINSGGSIIVSGTSTGNISYARTIPVAEKWYHVSPPLIGETIENYISNNSLETGNGNVGLFYYDNNTTTGFGGSGFIFYTPTSTGSFIAGRGYGTQVSVSSDVIFSGTMPSGDTSIAISEGTSGNITPDPSNLIGNPYPSYIAANTNANATNILTNNTSVLDEETLYLWDNTISDYVTINHSSAAYFLPPGQGFFVNSNTSGGSFNFLETQQNHQATDVFYKSSDPIFRIELKLSNNNQQKNTEICYFDDKTVNFDNGYDSSSFSDESESLLINTRLVGNHNSQNLAIQTLPTENLQSYVIPLSVKGNGEITFYADATNKPAGVSIFLEDRFLNTFNLLDFENVYTIDVGASINGIGRFYLHTQNKSLSVDDNFLNLISIYTSENKQLNISGLPNNKTKILLFDILGKQLIKEVFIADNTTKEISLSGIKNGVYIVKLETEKGVVSKKIILE